MSKKGKIDVFDFYYGLILMTLGFVTKLVVAINGLQYKYLYVELFIPASFLWGIVKVEESIKHEERMSEGHFQFCVVCMIFCYAVLSVKNLHDYFYWAAFVYAFFCGVIEKNSRVDKK